MSPACPICQSSQPDARYAPFCSKRCADVDLQRWFSGRYAIPAQESAAENGEDSEDSRAEA